MLIVECRLIPGYCISLSKPEHTLEIETIWHAGHVLCLQRLPLFKSQPDTFSHSLRFSLDLQHTCSACRNVTCINDPINQLPIIDIDPSTNITALIFVHCTQGYEWCLCVCMRYMCVGMHVCVSVTD